MSVDQLGDPSSENYKELHNELKESTYALEAFGVFGFIKLINYKYLIMIKHASLVGKIITANIYRVQDLEFIALDNTDSTEVDDEDK